MKSTIKIKAFRTILFGTAIAIQLLIMIGFILKFNQYFAVFYGFSIILSVTVVLWILNNKSNPAYKIAWLIPIMLFPIFGGLFYLFFGGNKTGRKTKKLMGSILNQSVLLLNSGNQLNEIIKNEEEHAGNQSGYIQNYAHYPPYVNREAEYLASGEKKFEKLKEELNKAEQYIFLEYFIIEEGLMWNGILEILKEKAASGVDVRVIYDGAGCLETLPYQYKRRLEEMGIQCCVFNPMHPILSARLNNRDHRKIAVIDGSVGFVGGINLADEYINQVDKHGHWKDAALMIKGEAVWSLTVMFLSVWDYIKGSKEDPQIFQRANPKEDRFTPSDRNDGDGYVQPFADSPLDDEPVGETVYLNLINKAKRYVYITTPYLIIDNEMVTALCAAAKGGVDVRIITPYHADKWYVHAVTRSYYDTLVESGVRIYEYTPGFIHSKTFAVDDEYGLVGTINMDYRSLYLHFECGIWLYRCSCIYDMKHDFQETMRVCTEITKETLKQIPLRKIIMRSILRVFAPLM